MPNNFIPLIVNNAPIDPSAFMIISIALPVPAKSVEAPRTSPSVLTPSTSAPPIAGTEVHSGQLDLPSLRPSDNPSPTPRTDPPVIVLSLV